MNMLFLASENPLDHVTDIPLVGTKENPIITMHMVTITVVMILFVWAMRRVAKAIETGPESKGNDRYVTKGRFAQFIEVIILYLRDEMLTPVMGEKTARRYLPFLLTLFFFILFNNVIGLIPITGLLHVLGVHKPWIGGTATGNIAMTAALAVIAFVAIELHGLREQGVKGWLIHNFGGLVPGPKALYPVAALVFVVEIAGHIIKPTALAIRLFANMLAGHTLMAVLLGFGAMAMKGGLNFAGVAAITAISGIGAVLITYLELFVAFLQAFIFMFLTAVFISLMSHHDEEHEHEEEHGHEAAAEPVAA